MLTTAARYSELNKILCALRQAQASPSLATDLGSSSDLKEHIRATLNEAVRLRADTEVLQSKLNVRMPLPPAPLHHLSHRSLPHLTGSQANIPDGVSKAA